VVRVWQLPPAELLKCVATLPLAPIANVSQADLPDVIDAMKQQLDRVAEPSFASEI